jgi:hypothetical protein
LPLPIGCDNVHGTPYFLPWHRAYLYFFERALRYRVERAMLAWWDWRTGPQRPAQLPQAFRARTVHGQGNPLHSARVSRLALEQGRRAGLLVGTRTRREPGDAALLPRAGESAADEAGRARDERAAPHQQPPGLRAGRICPTNIAGLHVPRPPLRLPCAICGSDGGLTPRRRPPTQPCPARHRDHTCPP